MRGHLGFWVVCPLGGSVETWTRTWSPPFRRRSWVSSGARRAFDKSSSSKSFCLSTAWRVCTWRGKDFSTSELLVFSWCSEETQAGGCSPLILVQQKNWITVGAVSPNSFLITSIIFLKGLKRVWAGCSVELIFLDHCPFWFKLWRQNLNINNKYNWWEFW